MPAAAPAAAVATQATTTGGRVDPRPVDSILVVVNSEVITRQEVAERLDSVEKRMAAQNVQQPPRAPRVRQRVERRNVERAQAQTAKASGTGGCW
ncbi:hypothetical protein [Herbaspirillum sp. VT-16-41]|uniref:hypothetical protein n=1 Tax=Herbaspirillum sp. VT-16-41 TaxID=1953765 RepID=UPI0009815E2B|nr:hypothetical protein [Herbaspirillum sp. VT-16-41]